MIDYVKTLNVKSRFPTSVPSYIGGGKLDISLLDEEKDNYMTLPDYPMAAVRADLTRLRAAHNMDVNGQYRMNPAEKGIESVLGKRDRAATAVALLLAAEHGSLLAQWR